MRKSLSEASVKFIKILKGEMLIAWVLIVGLYVLSYTPTVINYLKVPADRHYLGGPDYPVDFVGNMIVVRQGFNGHWQRVPQATSTIPGKGAYLKSEYILIGQLARLLRLDPFVMYHLSKFILSLLTILFIYAFIRKIYPGKNLRLISLFLVLFSTGLYFPNSRSEKVYEILFSDFLVFSRLTQTAHHYTLGALYSLLSFYSFIKILESHRRQIFLVMVCLSGFISSTVYAPTSLLTILTLAVFFLFYNFLITIKGKSLRKWVSFSNLSLVLFAAFSLIPVLYYRSLSQYFDFNTLSYTEKMVPFGIIVKDYILIVGMAYLLAILSLPYIIKTKNIKLAMLYPFSVIHPVAIYILSPFLNLNLNRFLFTPYFVIYGILAAGGIVYIAKLITDKFQIRSIERYCQYMIFLAIVILGYRVYFLSFNSLKLCLCLDNMYMFGLPKKEEVEVISWLEKNVKKEDIVLTSNYSGMLIPMLSGNRVYTSWWHLLISPQTYWPLVNPGERFYSNQMSDQEAISFLKKNNISYVYFGYEEKLKWAHWKTPNYPFLQKVKQVKDTTLYAVVQ